MSLDLEKWYFSATQITLKTPYITSTLLSDLQRGSQGATQFLIFPINSFPGLRNQLGHMVPLDYSPSL